MTTMENEYNKNYEKAVSFDFNERTITVITNDGNTTVYRDALHDEDIKIVTDIAVEQFFDSLDLGTGKSNAVKLDNSNGNSRISRRIRREIQEANANGDLIINDGDGCGYYRPDLTVPAEREAAERYIRSMVKRGVAALSSAQAMSAALLSRIDIDG